MFSLSLTRLQEKQEDISLHIRYKLHDKLHVSFDVQDSQLNDHKIEFITSKVKVLLWSNSHLSFLSRFKTGTSSRYETKKNGISFFQISLFLPEMFKFF